MYPEGFKAPDGKVFGRTSCCNRVPFVPRYMAVICSAAGRSRWNDNCQFCTLPTRKFGSMANVFGVMPGTFKKPFASVNGFARVFWTLRLFDSGDCCAICVAITWYTFVLR